MANKIDEKVAELKSKDFAKLGRGESCILYGSWCKGKASKADIITWCDARIECCQLWLNNLRELKLTNQKEMFQTLSPEDKKSFLEAIGQVQFY